MVSVERRGYISRGSYVSTILKQPYKPHSFALVEEEQC